VHDFFVRVENLSFSTWVRESGSIWAFPMLLFLHTLGMSIVAGGAAVIDFAVLGLWPRTAPVRPLERFYPLLWTGFVMNMITGVAIFMKDASVYSRNFDFWIKLVFVVLGMVILFRIRKLVFADPELDRRPVTSLARRLAWANLFCWFAAICAGRLIAYVGPVAGL